MSRDGKALFQTGMTVLGAGIGTLVAPGVGTAIGASIGGSLGKAGSSMIADDKPLEKFKLAMGPGNEMASYSEGELGKDYTMTKYYKDPGTSPLAKGLQIADQAIQTGAQIYGSLSAPTPSSNSAINTSGASKFSKFDMTPNANKLFQTPNSELLLG